MNFIGFEFLSDTLMLLRKLSFLKIKCLFIDVSFSFSFTKFILRAEKK